MVLIRNQIRYFLTFYLQISEILESTNPDIFKKSFSLQELTNLAGFKYYSYFKQIYNSIRI